MATPRPFIVDPVLTAIAIKFSNLDKLKDFKRQVKESGAEVINQDFESRMRGLSQQLLLFGELGTQALRRIGVAFASNLPMANRAISMLLQAVVAIDAKWPGLIDSVLSWTGAMLAAGAGIAILTPVFSALAAAIALIVSPIGLVIAGIAALAAGAAYLYSNWATVGPQLSALWTDIGAKFSAGWESIRTGQALEATISWLTTKIPELATAVIAGLPGMIEAGGRLVAALGEGLTAGLAIIVPAFLAGLGQLASAVSNNAAVLFTAGGQLVASLGEGLAAGLVTVVAAFIAGLAQLASSVVNLPGMMEAGGQLVASLWEGAKAKFAEFISWIATIPSQIVAAIGSIDLSNIIKWPSMPSWLGGGAGQPGAASGAKGAPAPATDPMGSPLGGGFNPTSSPAPAGGSIGGSNGFAKTAAANSNVQVGGKIVVEATEGARVVNVQSTNPAVPVTPNRGAMLGRA